jgi:DNA-binding MarR family transcriptional regulator
MAKKQNLLHMAQELEQHLRLVRERLRQPMETEFARGELTGPQRSVMQALVHSEGMSLKELTKTMGLAHSTVSGIVDRLEKRGMATRQPDANDRRVTKIVVTKQVRDFLRDRLPVLTINPVVAALRRASPKEREQILLGLRILKRVVGNGPQV